MFDRNLPTSALDPPLDPSPLFSYSLSSWLHARPFLDTLFAHSEPNSVHLTKTSTVKQILFTPEAFEGWTEHITKLISQVSKAFYF